MSATNIGKGKGKGAAPPLPAGPLAGKGGKKSKDAQAPYIDFEVEVERRRPLAEPFHWSEMVDIRVGLGCTNRRGRPKEIQAVLQGLPVADWNSSHSAHDRVRVGDILWAVDGTEVMPLDNWTSAISASTTMTTLTIRRLREVRRVMSITGIEHSMIGQLLSGEEAFSLPASAAAATANHLRDEIARALRTRSDTLELFDGGRRLADAEWVGDMTNLVVYQIENVRPWVWAPPAKVSAQPQEQEAAEALPVDSSKICFQRAVEHVHATIAGSQRGFRDRQAGHAAAAHPRADDPWVKAAEGHWTFVPPPVEGRVLAEALPVDTSALLPVAAAHRLLAAQAVPLFAAPVGAHVHAPDVTSSGMGALVKDVRVEAAAWLRSAAMVLLGLPGVEALMLEGRVDARCAAAATCDLLEALVGAERWDDVSHCAAAVLAEQWQEQVVACEHSAPRKQQRARRKQLRMNLGDMWPGFEVSVLPLGQGLPMLQADIIYMHRAAMHALARAAKSGHAPSLASVVGLIDTLDPMQQGGRLAATTTALADTLLASLPDEHEALLPALLKLLRIRHGAYSALRRLRNLELAAADASVAESLRDLIVELTPPPSKSFVLMLDVDEPWTSHPTLVSEAEKLGLTVDTLAPMLNVDLLDGCGYPVSDGGPAGKCIRVSNRTTVTFKYLTQGSWEHLAPLVVALLRRLSQTPKLRQSDEVLTAFCLLSTQGLTESRCLALEALLLLAPSGHAGALKAACEGSVAEDVAVRAQAVELMMAIAQPEDVPALHTQLAAHRDVHAAWP
eukprot:CAMPEP_0117468018 /NCGR_PEP_ID=MMETSP0784-20121206/5958_1 /TAXON_ID=39447 /ORGANISM="" /LENGTH=787 /DNA_ID=CAMNT_0005262011 /DNA_START=8 /DNA_END=2367 /DNA_ORIENTATION=+